MALKEGQKIILCGLVLFDSAPRVTVIISKMKNRRRARLQIQNLMINLHTLPLDVLEKIFSFGETPNLPMKRSESDGENRVAHDFSGAISMLLLKCGRRDLRFLYTAFVGPLQRKYYASKPVSLNHPFFDFIATQDNCVVAGGFATQLWLSAVPKSESDIDLYILGKIDKMLDILKKYFIDAGADQIEVLAHRPTHSVFQVNLPDLPYTVQIILFEGPRAPEGIVESFDLSHCRCFLYKGRVYATPEAERSLIEKRAFVRHSKTKICRVKKACARYVDTIINVEEGGGRKCSCSALEWKSIPWSDAKFCADKFYTGKNSAHETVNKVYFKRMELGTVRGLSLLERMAEMYPAYTFKLKYYRCPKDMLSVRRYFYTQDKATLKIVETELKRNRALIAQIRDRAEKKVLNKRVSRSRRVFPRLVRLAKCCEDILAPHEHDTFGYIFIGGAYPPEFRDGVEYTLILTYSFDRVDFVVEDEFK